MMASCKCAVAFSSVVLFLLQCKVQSTRYQQSQPHSQRTLSWLTGVRYLTLTYAGHVFHLVSVFSNRPGDFVVLSRNCHQSALAACVLCGTTPVFAEVRRVLPLS